MFYVLTVTAVIAGFGLAAFCAAVFHVRSGAALLAILVAAAFATPALVAVLTAPGPGIPWQGVGFSFGLALAIAATAGITRLALLRRRVWLPHRGRSARASR